ncbi:MAG: hypothetical protein AAF085_02900 [Planctomycetota bacterium]
MTKTKCFAGLAALCLTVLAAWPGQADSLQREGLPLIDGVTLIGVEDGKLKYRTAGGDQAVELKDVVALSIDSVPEFKAGVDAMKEGQLRTAQRSFENVWGGTRVQWIKHFAGYFLVQVYDQRGEPVDAAAVYAQLAADKADLHFLSKPPVASLSEADENEKTRMGEQIMAVVQQTEDEHRKVLRDFHRQIVGEDAPLPPVDDTAGRQETQNNEARANSKVILPNSVWKVQDRPNQPEGKWDSINLLAKGDAKGTLEAIKPWLSNPGDLPEKLFIKGVAELMLADESKDKDAYLDAGLTFMRIVIHFQRAGQSHPLVAPARLEVAYIHQQIGREDIYESIMFGGDSGAGVNLAIDDQKAYPEYRKRYYQIIGEEVPKDDDQP